MSTIFLSSMLLAFSGAMMPGPLLTYTVDESLIHGPRAGIMIITGHALLEVMLIVFIFLGFDMILQSSAAQMLIGIVGGVLLIVMGAEMIYKSWKNKIQVEGKPSRSSARNMVLSGFIISAANPYFLLWWAVIGLGFLLQAYRGFGLVGIAVFFVGHITADYLWYGMISVLVGTTRRFIKQNLYRIIVLGLGAVLVVFGASFAFRALI